MTFMINNKIFLDSSILVEYVKGNKVELLDHLLNDANSSLFISQIVISEFYFHALAAYGNKSPLSLKMSASISNIMRQHQPQKFLQLFNFLADDTLFIDATAQLMKKYNLLPNDALIIANCQYHNIEHIASYDINDLTPVCKSENMVLISSVQDFKTAFI